VVDVKGKIEILRRMVVIAVNHKLRGKLSDSVIVTRVGFHLRMEGFMENFPCGNAAFAALAGDSQAFAQLADGGGSTFGDGGLNLAISYAFAQAYVHREILRFKDSRIVMLMRILVNYAW
jgi:hypothetical protein